MENNGVNYLFDVLFHETMESHPNARQGLNDYLSRLYSDYTPSQRRALDEVFRELFREPFPVCFKTKTEANVLTNRKMMNG